MLKTIPYNKSLKKITPYEPGKSNNKKKSRFPLIKLSSNEACLDFSSAIQKKIIVIGKRLSLKLTDEPILF